MNRKIKTFNICLPITKCNDILYLLTLVSVRLSVGEWARRFDHNQDHFRTLNTIIVLCLCILYIVYFSALWSAHVLKMSIFKVCGFHWFDLSDIVCSLLVEFGYCDTNVEWLILILVLTNGVLTNLSIISAKYNRNAS